MNPALVRLLHLRQGDQAIEEYVQDFCGLCHLVAFNDVALKDIFRVGLYEPIRSQLPGGKIHWSLERYIDYALLLAGSPLNGVADEEPRNCAVPAPEHFHVPTFMSGVVHVMLVTPEPAQVMPAKPKPANVMSATPGPAHIMPVKSKFTHVMST